MLEEVAQILYSSAGKPVNIMKQALISKIRAGNKRPQSTTGKTANSIFGKIPQVVGGVLEWVFTSNASAVRLNNGGSLKTKGVSEVPYSGKGGGGQSAYIGALIKWARQKYGLDEQSAKRMAFKVAAAAKDRGRTVKSPGWLDDAKKAIEKQINDDLTAAIALVVNKKINQALKL
jgi:hypothetical protein